ncbi:hypothetical protein AS4_12740 [Acinetobacter guillouiae]|nr:hypothetical protein AS4_12740 [Acinetobacter guillouiae]
MVHTTIKKRYTSLHDAGFFLFIDLEIAQQPYSTPHKKDEIYTAID